MKAFQLSPCPKFITTCLVLAGIASSLPAEEPVVQADLPAPVNLNGEWQFKLLPDADSARDYDHFFQEDFDASDFSTIRVPSNWALEGFEDPRYVNGSEAEGFYRYTFEVPESASELRSILHFEGVWVSAEVWLNGVNLGRHDSGFTAFGFDISDELRLGEENRIAVRVRQQIPAELFKFDANDDWGLAGIYRDVWIEFSPKHLYIENVEVATDLDETYENADLQIRAFVVRHERDHYIAPSPPFTIRATLSDPDGRAEQVLEKEITVAGAHNGRDEHLSMAVTNPRLWTAETPELYLLKVEIERSEKIIHRWEDTIGFREVSTDGGILKINGQAVKLRGVASHDLHPDTGRATTREQWMKDIRLMKEANINTVRLAHYPHAEGFIRLCDEYGLYVLDEIPLGFGGERMNDPVFASGMLLRIHETIKRDRNRPSVIIWNFGNEDRLSYLHTLGLRTIKGIDPTRPVLLPFRAEPELPPEVDILAPHYWKTDEYDRIGATADRPVVSTEYTHAMGTEGLGELEQRWKALTGHPAGAGAMIWLWADQGLLRPINGKPVFDPMEEKASYTREGGELVRHSNAGPDAIYDAHGNYGTDGIVNPDRSLTWDYYEAKAVYAPVEVKITSTDVAPGSERVAIPIYNGYDFTQLNTCSIEWSLFRDAEVIESGVAKLDAAPHETAYLELPVGKVSGMGEYYAHLKILRADGTEMVTRSVRLRSSKGPMDSTDTAFPVRIRSKGNLFEVTAGENNYTFNEDSGEIESISRAGNRLTGSANIVVWRKSTYNERNRYDRRDNQHDWNTFMQNLDGRAVTFDVEKVGDVAIVRAQTIYTEDNLNTVTVNYRYTVLNNGQLNVELEVLPEMDIPELPEIGIVLDLPESLQSMAWLGEGPGASLPGKQAATRFGWWQMDLDSPEIEGSRSGLEWAKLRYAGGSGLKVQDMDGVRLEEVDGRKKLRILSHLGGAWTKNGPPEWTEWFLNLEPGKSFTGTFTIWPTTRN